MDELSAPRELDAAGHGGWRMMSAPAPSYDGASLGVSVVASVLDALLDRYHCPDAVVPTRSVECTGAKNELDALVASGSRCV